MDSHSLLCDEVWLTTIPPTPTILDHNQTPDKSRSDSYSGSLYTDKDKEEDWEQALNVCLEKELGYMPEPGYQDRLQLSGMVLSRFRVIQWLVKSQSRLNLLCQTVFNAANYFDRFVSMNQCKGWKYWMVELLGIACLSVASKFGEATHPPLHEIQMEDLDHSFQSGLIQRMELTLLKTLEWKLGSITPYSYIDLLMCDIESTNSFLLGDLTSRLTELLLDTLLDYEFLGFRPAVIAISAVRCVIGGSLPSTYMTRLIPEDQKDNLVKCHKIMEEKLTPPFHKVIAGRKFTYYCCPSSPVTVLTMEEHFKTRDFPIDDLPPLSKRPCFDINHKSSKMERKRDQES